MVEPDFDSVEEVDEMAEELADLLREEQPDLAVAIDNLLEATHEADEDADPDDVAESITLPFYEEDREMAFTIGLTVGALLETREYIEEDDEEEEEEEEHRLAQAEPATPP